MTNITSYIKVLQLGVVLFFGTFTGMSLAATWNQLGSDIDGEVE